MEKNLKNLYIHQKATAEAHLWARSPGVLTHLENILYGAGQRVCLKAGRIHRAEKILLEDKLYFLKIFYVKNLAKLLFKYPLKYRPPFKAVFNALLVSERGFPVILPLGFFIFKNPYRQKAWGGLLSPYYLEFETLPALWDKARQERNLFESLMQDILKLLQKLHEAGLYIRDTKVNNFLVRPGEEPLLFDLDQVKFFRRPLPQKLRLKNYQVLRRTLRRQGIPEEWLKVWFEKLL
ncbi:hypothetical protein FVE67_05445 [Thermosulfurimonas marina]|uniref:Protein kinase domain-containing protein n=1 Tax=Thermosulfurimonas marina TaxID=2047767 RepID=A0A6H1WSW8_9BACT|nr:lipopolysaccharide kinase InaA family protein [Thermosulfurimonas marina]QJA06282.1 hypothetical protein FVE67_05445 [Thermosulfurimonas marina]